MPGSLSDFLCLRPLFSFEVICFPFRFFVISLRRKIKNDRTMTNLQFLSILPSGSEWIIILVVVLLLFGGKKIPELMRGLGKGVKSFKEGVNEAKEEISKAKEEIDEPVEKKQ